MVSDTGGFAQVAVPRTILIAHPSPDQYGADRMLLETVAAFVGAGWRVVVTIPTDGPLGDALTALGAELAGCPTVVLRKAYLRGFGLVRLFGSMLRAIGPSWSLLRRVRPDVVWVNTITVPLWQVLARGAGIRVVVHAHEAEDSVARVLRRALALPLSFADAIVVNSASTGRTLESDGLAIGSRLRLVYNGVAGPAVSPATVAAPPRPETGVRLLFVGRLSERKGPDVLIDMLAELIRRGHDARLELVGAVFPGYEHFEARLHEKVHRSHLDDRVEFTGFLASVWQAYERSDIAFVPSRVEPLGNTAVEAMLAGVPVVCSRVQGLIEVADGGRVATLVEPGDALALADAVEQLLADWPATHVMAHAACDSARERFGPAGYRAAVLGVADSLVRHPRRPPATVVQPVGAP